MKRINYLAVTALTLVTLSACKEEPRPNPQAAEAPSGFSSTFEITEETKFYQVDIDLINAVINNNPRRVRSLIDNNGANPFAYDQNGITTLMYAAKNNNSEIVNTILDKMKSSDTQLLDIGDKEGKTALIYATEAGAADIINDLRKKGANPNIYDGAQRFPLLIAAEKGDIKSVEALLKNISGVTPPNPSIGNKNGDTAILAAVRNGNQELIRVIAGYGADINASDVDGINPLTYAVLKNDKALFDYLITLKADINKISSAQKTPLVAAIEGKNFEFAKHILDQGADPNISAPGLPTPVQVLVLQEGADPTILAALISKGAKIEGADTLQRAIRKGNAPIVKMLFDNGLKPEVLETQTTNGIIMALNADAPDIALLMIENGAQPTKANEEGFTALALAAKISNREVFEALIKAGADVNQSSRNKSSIPLEIVIENDDADLLTIMFNNKLQASPDAILLRAVGGKQHNIIPVVLAYGAKPNIMNAAGQPVLWLAIAKDDNKTAQALIDAGALLDVQDNEKQLSPLSLAIARANVEMATILINAGAKPDLTDRNGFTSLTYATLAGQTELLKLLISKGASVNAVDANGNSTLQLLNDAKMNPQRKKEINDILVAAGAK